PVVALSLALFVALPVLGRLDLSRCGLLLGGLLRCGLLVRPWWGLGLGRGGGGLLRVVDDDPGRLRSPTGRTCAGAGRPAPSVVHPARPSTRLGRSESSRKGGMSLASAFCWICRTPSRESPRRSPMTRSACSGSPSRPNRRVRTYR